MMNDELYHHGKKGQKWGVMNGPPYPLNAQGLKKFKANAKKFGDKVEKGKEAVRLKLNKAANTANRVSTAVKANGARRSAKAAVKQKQMEAKMAKKNSKMAAKTNKKLDKDESKKNDLRNLSDQELQKRINRLNMERQYRQLMAEKEREVDGGKGYVRTLATKTVKQMAEKGARELGDKMVKDVLKKMDESGKSDFEKKYERMKKDTANIKILNQYLKEMNTNERYSAGDFGDKKKKKKKDDDDED